MTADHQDWKRLADAVQRRRHGLGLRQADLRRHGGPSQATVRNIEQAARTRYNPRTFAELERALKWRAGTAEQIVAGTAPAEEWKWEGEPDPFNQGLAYARAIPGRGFDAGELERTVEDPRILQELHRMRMGERNVAPAQTEEVVEQWDNPTLVIGRRVHELRTKRGWTHEELAGRCFGVEQRSLTPEVLAAIESNTRGYVTVDELFSLGYVLDCAPVNLAVPLRKREDVRAHRYWVAPDRAMTVNQARQWARGDREWSVNRIVAPGIDPLAYLGETPEEEWRPPERSPEEVVNHAEDIRGYREMTEQLLPSTRLLYDDEQQP